ncbi:alpha/beta hydrolase [Pseudohalioglobus sediminis]|uniref:Alpha/beta hydrolase n=1 Tax=Pseudohalioglobus sediminis TaxID=2606449 RepID=A0A5B0WWK1_9GAMM|nr:alpha/beta hydrolase [Pseudohalioglobus sediminis]KAA1190521.1 alpha/beta hydrolase [Pseudohalioglobus sediminis]
MDWLLALLAIFNLVSMITVFAPRAVPRKAVPWVTFGTALLATELAWIWLPFQALLALLFCLGGALDSTLGNLALTVLLITWAGLVWAIWKSTKAEATVESALVSGLGHDYRAAVPAERREEFRNRVTFSDWRNPVGWGHPDVEVIKHIPYGPAGVRQQLDIYRPRVLPEGGCPVLLQIHGGAWMIGDKGSQALPLMYHLASKGWICVAANYRLSPSVSFPTHLTDCKKALCWIRENGAEYGMDTDFVAVTGGSAGGHLTALMGLTANRKELQEDHPDTDTSLQAAVPFYGVYDFLVRYNQHPNKEIYQKFLSGKVLHETLEDNPALWDLASPVAQIHQEAPPFMLLHGTHDTLAAVMDARVFADKLRETSEQAVVYVEMPGAEHAWEIFHSLRTEHTIDGVHRFLEWALAEHRAGKTQDTDQDPEQANAGETSTD